MHSFLNLLSELLFFVFLKAKAYCILSKLARKLQLGGNNRKFFNAISESGLFQSRREEVITSQHYFCRVPNKEFNFSSNPTFATASDGSFTQATFFKNPKTFITQVGLYNDAGELLAVAKLSKPLLKSYSREAIIKVKLDF